MDSSLTLNLFSWAISYEIEMALLREAQMFPRVTQGRSKLIVNLFSLYTSSGSYRESGRSR
jgi:hypothetical protein